MSERLIRNYSLRVGTPECHADAEWFRAYVDLDDDIGEALPYLNAELKGLDYIHSAGIMLWARDGRRYAFRPREIAIAPVATRAEAEELAKGIVDTVNDIWDRRDDIKPVFEGRKAPPRLLDIFKLLPGTNCRECGYPTCMAYAAALRNNAAILSLCLYIPESEYMKLSS